MPFIDTPGARIPFARTGSGPAVLLVQGAGVIGGGWRPQIERLAREYTLVAFDNAAAVRWRRMKFANAARALACEGVGAVVATLLVTPGQQVR